MSSKLTPKQRNAVNRIAALILVNAMIFQEVLAKTNTRVRPLSKFRGREDIVTALSDQWELILEQINYYPIFHVAHGLISELSADADVTAGVTELVETALRIVRWRAALRHDLAGRIYHRLLSEAKHLGAYYTSIPTATLLLKLALRPEGYDCDWHALESVGHLRIADLACGTGTLLMAAADVVMDNYLRACVAENVKPRPDEAHHTVVEKVIYGFDVLASALHLTASSLALRVPDIPVNVTNLYSMPLGGTLRSLGSLEFIPSATASVTLDLFGRSEAAQRVEGKGKGRRGKVSIPPLDLCVMNPPFVRSVGGNLLFGNLPEKERTAMQARLQEVVRDRGFSASITAGLGSVFAALGDRQVKPGGWLALVLPRGLVSGVAWQRTRALIASRYHLEYLIVSHEADHWNFSENTALSEVLVLARKRENREAHAGERVTCVNLWQQPRTAVESLSLARSLHEGVAPDLATGQGALQLSIGSRKLGEAVSVPWEALSDSFWGFGVAFAQAELLRAFHYLKTGRVYLPGQGTTPEVKLTALADLGELGFDRRDIHDGFELAEAKSAYPAFWGHATASVASMNQSANRHLEPLSAAKKNRNLRKAADLWKSASRILLAERLRLNNTKVVTVRLGERALSNVWWTFTLRDGRRDIDTAEKSLVLWLNSTLGLLLLLGHREETEGGWVGFKKPVLGAMPVLDIPRLSAKQRKALARAYDEFADANLLALPLMAGDQTRIAIDNAIAKALGLPDFGPLRELLAREPIICVTMDRLLPGT